MTVAPEAGDVRVAVGGVVSGTVTDTGAELPTLAAASRAAALRVWVPGVALALFQVTEYGAAVSSPPSGAPSSLNCTPTTPTLSEALAVTEMVPVTVAPGLGELIATVGGVLSLKTVTVTGSDQNQRPSAFWAAARSVWDALVAVLVSQGTE